MQIQSVRQVTQKYNLTVILFLIILIFSFFHSMTFFDYNLPLFTILFHFWQIKKESRIFVFSVILLTIPFDFLLVIFFGKTFKLRREFIFQTNSFAQSLGYFRYVKSSFSINIIVKLFLVIWILVTKKYIQSKCNTNYVLRQFQKNLNLFCLCLHSLI